MKKKIIPFAATDVCVFRFIKGELYIYVVKLKHSVFKGKWALPGGLVREGEDLDSAIKRIYKEGTGNSKAFFEQLYTFSNPNRDPRTRSISTAYLAFPKGSVIKFMPCDKYEEGKWVNVAELNNLAYDHPKIVSKALDTISSKLNYSSIGLLLLSEKFTLTDLQDLYEYFLKIKIDKRNFRRKILSFDIIKDSNEILTGIKARPAKLYMAKEWQVKAIPMFN